VISLGDEFLLLDSFLDKLDYFSVLVIWKVPIFQIRLV